MLCAHTGVDDWMSKWNAEADCRAKAACVLPTVKRRADNVNHRSENKRQRLVVELSKSKLHSFTASFTLQTLVRVCAGIPNC